MWRSEKTTGTPERYHYTVPRSQHGDRKDKLAKYREKRRAGATPEPFGAEGFERPGLFVVQKHAATHMHYDFRLEIAGVLVSWAVPKGPSLDPDAKRFAAATEDHPMEYGDFEGIIPKGNYGAGAVILWDQGRAVHEIDPEEGLRDGKLLFSLYGYKLRGLFTLFRLKTDKEWLLMKKPDAAASADAEDLGERSILSGLTVEELRDGNSRVDEITHRLDELGAKRRSVRPERVKVMLAQLRQEPFSKQGWIFELKYDGFRVVAGRDQQVARNRPEVHLHYRSGREATAVFPDIVRFLSKLPYNLVVDGEAVVLDETGKPSFQLLQKRALLNRRNDIQRAAVHYPATYFVFDLLGLEGYDLRSLPAVERKEVLRRILPPAGPIRYADHIEDRGEAMYEQVRRMGLEGIVAKDGKAPYRGGRSPKWIKVRSELAGDFVIVGFSQPKSSRPGFGALHLGQFHGNQLVYAGRVGTGFNDRLLNELRAQLDGIVRPAPAVAGELPSSKVHVWVEPELVAEVKYLEYTEAGHLRHPAFVRLRDDKKPIECVRDDLPPDPAEVRDVEETPAVAVTRPQKVFWPASGYTKGDLDAYYQAAAPWLLPFLRDRPVVLDRYPDGIEGKSFFQKKAPDFVPEWVVTREIWSDEDNREEARYYLADDEQALRYLVNLGAIPLHIWHSRLEALQQPDWCVLDLDAKDAPFAFVVRAAREIRELTKTIGLPSFPKTSGATGLHVLIPLGSSLTYDQSKQLGEVLCKVIAQRLPEKTSIARLPSRRKGKVYLDYLQNGYGKLIVAPYSVRPLPDAPVSTPLRWREVNAKLEPSRFTIKTVPSRLKRMKPDPWGQVLGTVPDLPSSLARLAEAAD
jgi:bifunctional non-homologous end joining protein LigD